MVLYVPVRVLALALAAVAGALFLLALPRARPVASPAVPPGEGVLMAVRTDRNWIALTFDDGPDPRQTPALLQLLARYRDRATFFVLGAELERRPELAREILAAGSEVANHGLTHRSGRRLSRVAAEREVQGGAEAIWRACQRRPRFYRPPYGILTPQLLAAARASHQIVTLWSYDTRDWARTSAQAIAQGVLNHLRPGEIVLLHDGGGHRGPTVRAVEALLPGLDARGYRSVTLSELLAAGSPVWLKTSPSPAAGTGPVTP